MRYRRLGKTNLTVSELGFGAWPIGGSQYGNSYGPTDDAVSIEAVCTAADLGCNFFDTADVYGHGHSESILGQALRQSGKLNDAVIASKVGANFSNGNTVLDFSRQHITHAIEASLRRLGRDYLDLYQLHNPSLQIIQDGQVFETLDSLKASGKIRHYGVSIHTVAEGLACIENGKAETLQVAYNLFSLLQPETSPEQLFPQITRHNLGLIAREPLDNGFLSGKHRVDTTYGPGDVRGEWPIADRKLRISLAESLRYLEQPGVSLAQAALRFVLDEPAITTTIVGIKTPEQARENFEAVNLSPLSSQSVA